MFYPPTVSGGPGSSTSSPHLGVVNILIISHSNKCVVIAHIGFDSFTKWLIMLRGFICTYLPSSYLLEMSVHMPCLCLNLVFSFFLLLSFERPLCTLDTNPSSVYWLENILLWPMSWLFRKRISRNPALYFWWSQYFFFLLLFMLLVLYLKIQPKVTKISWYVFF